MAFLKVTLASPVGSRSAASAVVDSAPASKAAVSKHATPEEYRASTGLEALFGWLYLQGQNARIETLFETAWNCVYEAPAAQA